MSSERGSTSFAGAGPGRRQKTTVDDPRTRIRRPRSASYVERASGGIATLAKNRKFGRYVVVYGYG